MCITYCELPTLNFRDVFKRRKLLSVFQNKIDMHVHYDTKKITPDDGVNRKVTMHLLTVPFKSAN